MCNNGLIIGERTAVYGVTANIEACEMDLARLMLTVPDNHWLKGCDTIADTEPYTVVGCAHSHTKGILSCDESVAVYIAYKVLLLSQILPDTHRGTTPDITRIILNDATHHSVA